MRASGLGFSFVELAACLAIIGLLLMVAAPVAQTSIQRAKEAELRTALRDIREGIDRYKRAADQGRIAMEIGDSGYPPSLNVLVEGVVDVSSPRGEKLYFLRKVPRDPMYTGRRTDNAMTWGLRSYESPPEDPREGDDVFDVYSLSQEIGLNEVAYRDW